MATMSDENTVDPVTAIEQAAKLDTVPPQPPMARVSVLLGPDEGRTFGFGERCLIGRAMDSDVRLIDRGVSRHHARLSRVAGGGFVIEDLASRNGTLVNGEPITRA